MKPLWRRLQWFFHRDRFEREMEEEIRHHLALKAIEYGSPEAACRQFGNVTLVKEDSRRMWIGTFLEQLGQDIRYAVRAMFANKLFSAMAILSLALGIGANTAIYSFMDAIMLRAMPVARPGELAIVNWHAKKGDSPVIHGQSGSRYSEPGGDSTSPNLPFEAYEFLRDNNHVFATLFAYNNARRPNLVVDGQAEVGDGEYVSGDFFSGLEVVPVAGRLISPDDDRAGASPVVAITYAFWQRRFGGRVDAIGKSMLVNGKPFTVVGVTPPQFFGVVPQNAPQVFIPLRHFASLGVGGRSAADWFVDKHHYWIEMMGRLRPGVTLAQAQVELAGKFQGWVTSTAENDKERTNLPALWLQEGGSGVDSLRRQYSKPLYILTAMVGLILLIACANIANLLLARAEARRREMAVRLSLGAGRMRVIRQLLTESLLLSFCAGILGILFATWGIRSLTWLLANGRDNFTLHAGVDWRVLLFTMLVVVATGILFGLAPAIQATRVEITPALKESRGGSGPVRTRRFGIPFGLSHVLVVSQVAVSLLLVAAAGLFVRTLNNLESVQLGFNRENVLVFSLDGSRAGYKDAALKNLYAEMQRRLRSIAEVRAATMTTVPLVANWSDSTTMTIPGAPKAEGQRTGTSVMVVGPTFFETMQIPILMGRAVDERDRDGGPLKAVVNEVLAKKYFPGESPIGRHFFAFGGRDEQQAQDVEIVGVAKTARYNSLKQEVPPVTYISYQQTIARWPLSQMFFELRTSGDPLAVTTSVRKVVHDVSPQIPVADLTTQARQIDGTIVQERTFAELCTCFGVLALVLACVGLYGTMAYAVSRRTSEIGIRMALGAQRKRIVWMVLRQVLTLGAVGVVVGLGAVWETTAFLKSYLFGLQPNDPLALGSAVAILVGCAVLAGYAPAWRASRIDPMVALRHE
jgi:macrolide transport system ATP-binding/permease protein